MRMAVLVLQALAVQRGAPRSPAQQEAARAHVTGGVAKVPHALEAEHRVEDVERDHLHGVRRVRRGGGHPVAHAAGLVDAFLQDLPVLVFLVEHQLVVVLRRVELALLVPDAKLPEHALHAEGARFVRHDRHDVLADVLVADQQLQDLDEGHRCRDFAVIGALEEALEGGTFRHDQWRGLLAALRQVATQFHPPRAHVQKLRRTLGEIDVGHFFELVVGHRNFEAIAEYLDGFERHFLLLVRDVLCLARLAHAVALDRLGQDHRGLVLVIGRGVERGVHLVRIVAATIEVPDFLVAPVGHQRFEFRRVEEILAYIRAILALEGLVLAVDACHHPAHQDALLVAREQGVPVHAPHQLDHVPAGAAEIAFQFLDDLAVAAHRAVQPLQVAVDDKDQIVEIFARGHADGAHRLGFIHLAVTHEGPYLAAFGLHDAAVLQVLHEARLVDRHQRSQAHGDGGELPEIGHQPRMRIRRDTDAVHFLPVVVELRFGQPAQHVCARVDPGGRVTLHEHEVTAVRIRRRVPEVIEADVVQRGRRRETGDMPADVGVLVRAQHHRHCVPADVGAQLVLDGLIAGNAHLQVGGNRVDVRRIRGKRQVRAGLPRRLDQLLDQEVRAVGTFGRQHAGQRIEPFAGFLGVGILLHCVHDGSPYPRHAAIPGIGGVRRGGGISS